MALKNTKQVGIITSEIIKEYNLFFLRKNIIVQDLSFYIHDEKHKKDFINDDEYRKAIFNISLIIDKPYFVYFDKEKLSLLYYKNINNDSNKPYICVVIRLRTNIDSYVASMYPVSENKILRKQELKYKE